MERYTLKRYIKVLNGKIIDTTLLMPHTECYYVIDDKELWVESIEGTCYYLGKIVTETNNINELSNIVTHDKGE